jgi:hypothetical protein
MGMQRPDRGVIIIGFTLGGLIVLAILAALLVGAPDEEEFAEGTPERVIQDYVRAVRDRDREAAYAFFSSAAQRDMSFEEFSNYVSGPGDPFENRRIRLEDSEIDGERATLSLVIESFDDGSLFDSNRYEYERTVALVREEGAWKIDESFFYL